MRGFWNGWGDRGLNLEQPIRYRIGLTIHRRHPI